MATVVPAEKSIRAIVRSNVEAYAKGFSDRHISEADNPEGTLNMKIHNVFIAVLGKEIQYYSALSRSLDSSLGNMLESMAINIARLFYEVNQSVEGYISLRQVNQIAEILERYTRNDKKPERSDYLSLRKKPESEELIYKRKISDYHLVDQNRNVHHLIELKIGGDLDTKKARSEKEAILEQYAILSNTLPENVEIAIHFATAYNKYGEGKPWTQPRVLQYFSKEELLIGRDFWNFICQREDGYDIVLDEYSQCAPIIVEALNSIKDLYLK
ncbi:MAG: TdeIII family type II restriction endonuclease [Saprospiraceae bacterium]|nr:TdeIII family type II restriction endonuclease [Saprospiraceae bacterium]MDW8229234.1 TdeIII family type II restriction endonuclease [Saprospiraceae bacterium]